MNEERYGLPLGWVEVGFEQCIDTPKGPLVKIPQKQYLPQGKYPIIDQGSEFIAGYTNNKNNLFKGELPAVIFGDHTRIFKFVDFDFAIGADGTKILGAKQGINPKYLFYYLRYITLPSRGYSRHYRYLRENKILLAPENEQKRIVQKIENLLGRLNKTKQELARIPPLIKKFRQSILARVFSGELTKDWRSQQKDLQPASNLLDRIRNERKKQLGKKYKEPPPIDPSDLPELPKGWKWSRIEGLSELVTKGSTPTSYGYRYQDNGITFVKVENISNSRINHETITQFINKEAHDFLKRSQLKENDILFSIAGTIGRACIVHLDDLPANINQAIAIIRIPWSSIDNQFLLEYLTSYFAQSYAKSGMRGVGMNNISLEDVKNLVVLIPPYLEQLEIIKRISQFSAQTDTIEKSVKIIQAHCEKLTQSILAKAFRGELVEQDPHDEPAEELLTRLKKERERVKISKNRKDKTVKKNA